MLYYLEYFIAKHALQMYLKLCNDLCIMALEFDKEKANLNSIC